ncbi:tetratricopeptide repeat-containing sensor histidine kinase [Winogradskyella poriferorum]|uniref:tetratricopeptide repeat-containing sensor histidine kinase n=1 Tax=Winogradskyella poriferorum TaxID=307627 RepID=UPI003D652918
MGTAQDIEVYKDSIALELQGIKSDSLKATRFYRESTNALRRYNDLGLSRIYLDSAMYYSKQSGFKDSEAKCHFLYGLLERVSGNNEVALGHLEKNIKYFEKDSTNKAYALFQVAIIHRNLGDYEKSLGKYLEILKIFEHKKDSSAMASTYNSIANIYGDMDRYEESVANYKSAGAIFKAKNDQRNQVNTLNNMAEIYLRMKDTIASRNYAYQSLEIAQQIKEDLALGGAYYAIGRSFLSSDKNRALSNYLKAKTYYERINYVGKLVPLYNDLGRFYKNENNIPQSVLFYNKALDILRESSDLLDIKNTYEGLSDNYALNNNFKKAYEFQSLYIVTKDSLFNEQNIKSINQLQKQFETEKKDKEIATQQLEIQKQEAEIQKKKTVQNYMLGAIGFLIIGALLIWAVYKQKQKRKEQEFLTLKREYQIRSLEALIEGEEKERFRIAKELHDGVNGDLSAIKYKLSSLIEMNNKVIHEAINMIDDSCKQVRAISHNLVPPSLEKFSLVEAVEAYCNSMNVANEVEITFQAVGEEFTLTKKAEINILRIIQELVSNSVKHAKANEINVQVSFQSQILQVTVEDDGIGFKKDDVDDKGIGLANIDSRIQYLNAELDFMSNNKGTSYTFEIDLNKLDEY